MNVNKEQIEPIEKKIKVMNEKIDNFQEKIEKYPKKINYEFIESINELKKKRDRLDHKFETLKNVSGSAFDDLQIGVKMAWDDLNMAYDSAKERFDKAS